jgi:hypothetical protein
VHRALRVAAVVEEKVAAAVAVAEAHERVMPSESVVAVAVGVTPETQESHLRAVLQAAAVAALLTLITRIGVH